MSEARQLVPMRLHKRVTTILFREADGLGVSPAYIVEAMVKQAYYNELADFEPGRRVNNKTYSKE